MHTDFQENILIFDQLRAIYSGTVVFFCHPVCERFRNLHSVHKWQRRFLIKHHTVVRLKYMFTLLKKNENLNYSFRASPKELTHTQQFQNQLF